MPSGEVFDLYRNPNATAPASRKKASRRHPGESSSDPSKKRAQTENPPAPTPSKDMTSPLAPVDPTPPASVDPTSTVPIDPTPPAPPNPSPSTQSKTIQAEAILNTTYNSANDRLKKLLRDRRSQEAFNNVSTMKVN
ncbi:vegetative cell wall protein gp1-like [Humulus lupulus]|uniref:vegetative cell wall protein gp1-like n=1 Tax=Humulus lupulus TaxID=3486 RepID=UPI002B40A1A0|nr:vegetative cell wall protein gp1-like [Humulus lupulus]